MSRDSMTTPARDLLTALQSAPHGTPELSAKVVCALLAPEGAWVTQHPAGQWLIKVGTTTWWSDLDNADVTTSIDAATALIRRVRPDAEYDINVRADYVRVLFRKPRLAIADGKDEPLALCSTLIASQIEEEQ